MASSNISLTTLILLRWVGLNLFFLSFLASLFDSETRNGPDAKKKSRLREVARKTWALDTNTAPYHNFLQLAEGLQLHYLSSRHAQGKSFKNIIIFLHGFPDASPIWLRQLEASTSDSTLRLALDKPGCGGSDAIESYHPDRILAITLEAIVQLKQRHLSTSEKGRCVLVGHDWGAALAYRLAAETEGLFDQLVIVNGAYPPNVDANVRRRVRQTKRYLGAWTKAPTDFRPLAEAWSIFIPVLKQFWKSKYIALVTLPNSWTGAIPFVGRAVRYFNVKVAMQLAQQDAPKADTTTTMAHSCGPDEAACKTALPSGETYSNHVLARTISDPPGRWDERVRIYQEGAALEPWTTCPPQYQPKTKDVKLKYPLYIIHGVKDIAFDKNVIVDHMEDFMLSGTKGQEVVILPDAGHWNMIGDVGAAALEDAFTKLNV